jgi:3-deoxy-D-arabino-heptulosonate 7-phosphate (DAHP) synthase
MPLDVLDMVWTSGAGDNDGYTRPDYNADSYNAATNNYAYLHSRTDKTIMVDTSYASSGQPDRWSTATASALNDRIAEGVVGVLVSSPASNYQSAIQNLSSQLGSVCQ